MKKVLVLTLVLVMAFASSAMAAVNFSGEFTATAEQKNFKVFKEGYDLSGELDFTIGIKASDTSTVDEEEVTNWDLSAGVKLEGSKFDLGKYKLGLYDEWFTGYAWGNTQELSDKATYFGMITAPKAAPASSMRARLIVHVMDYADVTFDFAPQDNMRAFVNGSVGGFDLGLAYARKDWTTAASNTIVAQAGYDVPAGDIDVRLQAAVGANLAKDLGLGLGLSANSDVTEELNLNASVTYANDKWAGEGTAVATNSTILKAGAKYTEDAFQVSADASYTIKKVGDNTNTVSLTALYRGNGSVAFADLFKSDKWYTNDDLTVKAFASLTKFKLGEVGVEAVYPVVADMVWARAYGNYGSYKYDDETKAEDDEDREVTENGFKAGAEAYIQATSKLVVRPFVSYEQLGKVFTLKASAEYMIGLSDTTLDFTVQRVTAEPERASKSGNLIQASVTVPF